MSNRPKPTKRQHWLPQSAHLNNFTVDGKVHSYWFEDNGKPNFVNTATHKVIAPINIGVKSDLYETDKLPTNTVEKLLNQIEGEYEDALKKKILTEIALTDEERHHVATYITALENRSLLSQQHVVSSIDELEQMGHMVAQVHTGADASPEWTKQMAAMKDIALVQSLAISLEVNNWDNIDFCFLKPANYVEERFITSDHPVTITDFANDNSMYGLHHSNTTAECVVALTPELALFGNNCGLTGYMELDYNFVREVNRRTLVRSDKLIISATKIEQSEAGAIVHRRPQSLLLYLLADYLPRGRADGLIEAINVQIDDK